MRQTAESVEKNADASKFRFLAYLRHFHAGHGKVMSIAERGFGHYVNLKPAPIGQNRDFRAQK